MTKDLCSHCASTRSSVLNPFKAGDLPMVGTSSAPWSCKEGIKSSNGAEGCCDCPKASVTNASFHHSSQEHPPIP